VVVYELSPIDRWYGWTPFEEAVAAAANSLRWANSPTEMESEPDFKGVLTTLRPEQLYSALTQARKLAKLLGDDVSELREGPYFCPLPENESESQAFMLAWKMDNNGTTFVASSHYRLPWLDKTCSDSVDDL